MPGCHDYSVNRRQPLIFALIWLVTVAGASTLTWGVISSTGAKVGQPVPVSAATVSVPSATSSGASASPSSGSTNTSSAKPTGSTTTRPTKDPTSAKPTSATKTGSWSGAAGTVTAACKGSAVSLVRAIPNDGYRVQSEHDGTQVLEIEFERTGSREDDESGEVHLKISCSDGTPVFRRD
jgi:hypothetical protein